MTFSDVHRGVAFLVLYQHQDFGESGPKGRNGIVPTDEAPVQWIGNSIRKLAVPQVGYGDKSVV